MGLRMMLLVTLTSVTTLLVLPSVREVVVDVDCPHKQLLPLQVGCYEKVSSYISCLSFQFEIEILN